jgi:glycosyltransferase involved in cell wall biosynthesis
MTQIHAVVLIPAFNAGAYLKMSIDSLLPIKNDRIRIIVIDDASTDGSLESIRNYAERGLIEIRTNAKNLGKAESLNRAFREIETEYFILQDADDIALPGRVERQLSFMKENPEIALSSSFIRYINKEDQVIASGKLDLLSSDALRGYLSGSDPFGLFCPAAIIRRDAAKDPELGFRKQFWPADDIDLWNRIAEKGYQVRAQEEYLVGYRIHGTSAVTANFYRTRMKYEWVRESLRARRRGLPEPTEEEFFQIWCSASILDRFNRARKILAKGMYRAAGFARAEGKYHLLAIYGLSSLLLQPFYVLKRILIQTQRE